MLGADTELGEQRARLADRQPGHRLERGQRRLTTGACQLRAGLLEPAQLHRRPQPLRAGGQRDLTQQRADQRGLAAAVRPDDHHPLAVVDLHREGAQLERADIDDCIDQAGHQCTAARRGGDRHPQVPCLARLLDDIQPFHRSVCARRPPSQLLGLVDLEGLDELVVVVGLLLRPRQTLRRPLALALRALRQRRPLGVVLLPRLPRVLPGDLALVDVCLVAACEHGDPVGELVELGNVGHDPPQELAVVADQRHRTLHTVDELLEPIEAVEIEVVRRLVEQQHVEACQHQRSQADARCLSSR